MDKKEIRKMILNKRDNIEIEERILKDKKIFDSFVKSEYYKSAKVIFSFVSFGSEVNTKNIIVQAIKDHKTVCVPKVISKAEGIKTYRIEGLNELEEGYYHILEPKTHCIEIDKRTIDLIIIPGVSFDRNGGRIGYGGGFYDRFLYDIEGAVLKIALAYELQVLQDIPMLQHDIRIDALITEREINMFK